MPPDAEAADPWSVVVRGSFLVGLCGTCAWTSPARRARYSVEGDMRAHEVLCSSAAAAEVPIAAAAAAGSRLMWRRAGSASRHRAARSG